MDITVLEPHYVDYMWDRLQPHFERAASVTHGRYTANDIRMKLKNSAQQLWIAHEGEEVYGFATTNFLDYPQMRVLLMNFTGGVEFHKWHVPIIAKFKEFAKTNGCSALEAYGRGGWEKVFKNDGYKKLNTVFELPLGSV